MSKKDRIFLAGHNGLVGSAVLKKLKQLNYSNIVVANKKKLNLLDQSKVFRFLKKKKLNLSSIAQLESVELKRTMTLRVILFMKI